MPGLKSISWSSPERRNSQGEQLTYIPNEIYIAIFDYLGPSERIIPATHKLLMSKLSKVCRFFCSVALPRVCRTLEMVFFDAEQPVEDAWEKSTRFTVKLFQALKNPKTPADSLPFELASQVKKCSVTFFDERHGFTAPKNRFYIDQRRLKNDSLREWRESFLEEFVRAMAKMPNLRSLHIEGELSVTTVRRISRLRSLKSLSINLPDVVPYEPVDVPALSLLAALHLDEFKLDHYHSLLSGVIEDPLDEPYHELDEFLKSQPNITSLTSPYVPATLSGSNLKRLEILLIRSQDDLSILSNFLQTAKALDELIIHALKMIDIGGTGENLGVLLPLHRLKVLRCPPALLCVDSELNQKSTLRDLSLPTSRHKRARQLQPAHFQGKTRHVVDPETIQRLSVDLEILAWILLESEEAVFTTLEELEMGFLGGEGLSRGPGPNMTIRQMFKLSTAEANPFPNLRILTLLPGHSNGLGDLKYQQTQIDLLAARFPRLERVFLADLIVWEAIGDHGRTFSPFIPWRRKKVMKQLLTEDPNASVDYQGCFEKLGMTEDL